VVKFLSCVLLHLSCIFKVTGINALLYHTRSRLVIHTALHSAFTSSQRKTFFQSECQILYIVSVCFCLNTRVKVHSVFCTHPGIDGNEANKKRIANFYKKNKSTKSSAEAAPAEAVVVVVVVVGLL